MTDEPLFADVPRPEQIVAPLEVRDVVLDPTFGRRRDALLRTLPVHEIVERAGRSDSGIAGFDVRALILAAFDAVIARQGFPTRTTPAQVIELLSGIASIQNRELARVQGVAVAEHVLDGLTNRRMRERLFSPTSIVYADAGAGEVLATEVQRPFWLLREAEDPRTGEIYLEASADAVNALVAGLDIPIEDQQVALETILERQLSRGELDSAHATAIQARQLTAGYLIQIDELLRETERDLRGTDWEGEAPALIDSAMTHLDECLVREGRLLQHVAGGVKDGSRPRDGSEEVSTEKRARISAALTKLLGESRHLHTQLLDRLMGARGRFLDAQDNQMFRTVLDAVEFDLSADLMNPLLALHVDDGERVSERFITALLGPVVPLMPRWADLVESLLRAPVERGGEGDTQEEEFEFRPDPKPLVGLQALEDVRRLLSEVEFPIRLSALLAGCPDRATEGATAHDLLVAAALRSYDNSQRDPVIEPQHGEWAADSDDATFLDLTSSGPTSIYLPDLLGSDTAALADGTPLEGDRWCGDDLILCVDRDQVDAVLLGDLSHPLPARTCAIRRGVGA